MNDTLPILYSFRRCPYAMRARLAVAHSGVMVELREIELKNKPESMLIASPKGTVPVLVLEDGRVIDESLDIMHWALQENDPSNWLASLAYEPVRLLIVWNDSEFKQSLDRYKYADRYPEYPQIYYRQQGERFLSELESCLTKAEYLAGSDFGMADAAIVPFIRQFAAVNKDWFEQAAYPKTRQWLHRFLSSALFNAVMAKYQPWKPNQDRVVITNF